MRIGVIGVGIIGASVGWHLANHGAEVVMIDAGRPGEGVTNWTFSWVNVSNKTETKEYFDLNVAGVAAHADLAATLGAGEWWHPSGHIRWFEDSDGAERLKDQVDLLEAMGVRRHDVGGRKGAPRSRARGRVPFRRHTRRRLP